MPLKKNYSLFPGRYYPKIYGIPSFILIITGETPDTIPLYSLRAIERGKEFFFKCPKGEANILRVKDGMIFKNYEDFSEDEENLKILQKIDNVEHI